MQLELPRGKFGLANTEYAFRPINGKPRQSELGVTLTKLS